LIAAKYKFTVVKSNSSSIQLAMFGIQQLRNEAEGLREERDFFQGKYLSQVSEIANLNEKLTKSKREIARLREELMKRDGHQKRLFYDDEKKEDHLVEDQFDDDNTTLTTKPSEAADIGTNGPCESTLDDEQQTDDDLDATESVDEDEQQAVRDSAAKLLQWASYRESHSPSKVDDNVVDGESPRKHCVISESVSNVKTEMKSD
jgi:hypothetical protein